MGYWHLRELRAAHPAWRLLAATHAPLILSFLQQMFVHENRRAVKQSELAAALDDYLFRLRESEGEESFPKSGAAYLEDWSRADTAFLRKYYPREGDEAEFDLSPATEKAVDWINKLEQRQFVGTESRLQNVLGQMQQLVQLTQTDPEVRIQELEGQKQAIDRQISELRQQTHLTYDSTQVKERFFQLEDTARQLIGDFRQVEQNFRDLDVQVREKITLSEQSKGELLSDIFGDQDAIAESDQGKSFRAFWALLLSHQRQQQMSDWLEAIYALADVRQLRPDDFLRQLRFRLLEAGEKVQRTWAGLAEQLRRYLDDRSWRENKRILQLIAQIERRALACKGQPPKQRDWTELDDIRADIQLPMSRGLFRPDLKQKVTLQMAEQGEGDFDSDALFQQEYVDIRRLRGNIRQALQTRSQISLAQLCLQCPVEQGLAEILSYMNLASQDHKALIDDIAQDVIHWQTEDKQWKQVTLPRILFSR